jgi:hypothetical protein
MCLWESIGIAISPVDGEPLHPLYALQVYKAPERHTRGTCSEAEYLRSLVAIEGLEGTPPPDNDRIGTAVTIVFSRSPPFINIDIGCARNEQLQLLLIELRARSMRRTETSKEIRTIVTRSFGMTS